MTKAKPIEGLAPRLVPSRALRAGIAWVAAALVLSAMSCADDPAGDPFSVFIVEAQPQRGHAPLNAWLVVDFPGIDAPESSFEVMWDFGDGATVAGPTTVVHAFLQAGTYTTRVVVKDTVEKRTGEDEVAFEVLESAEIAISGVEVRPLQVQAGQNVQLLFSLRSEAVAVQTPFTLVAFLSNTDAVDMNDVEDVQVLLREVVDTMPAFGEAGAIADRAMELRIPETVPSGRYWIGVVADPDRAVGELDETNNLKLASQALEVRNPATDGPDLVPTGVVATPRRTRVLTSATVDFVVENRGVSPALAFGYQVIMSNDDFLDEQDIVLLEGQLTGVSTLEPVRVDDLLVPINPPVEQAGNYTFFVQLDPRAEVTEINEDNNIAQSSSPIVVTDEPILDADIVVLGFDVDPDHTYLGGAFAAHVSMLNQGTQATGSFLCTLYFSSDQVLDIEEDLALSTLNVYDLPGGTERAEDAIVHVPSFFRAGDYWAFVFCDASGVVVEYNEDNNIQRHPNLVKVAVSAEVDLYAEKLVLTPASPVSDGATATLAFDFCNDGLTGVGPSLARVYLSNDALPGANDTLLADWLLPSMEPETCLPLTVDIELSCKPWKPTYQLLLQVDVRDALAETNEGNNTAVLPGVLTIEGATCSCEDDPGEPNDFATVPFPLLVGDNPNYTLCVNDHDWYSIYVASGESLRVTMTHDPAFGELDLRLLDPGNAAIQTSGISNGVETVDTWLVPLPGDYLVEVLPAAAGEKNRYDLRVELIPPATGGVDLLAVDVEPQTTTPDLDAPFDVSLSVANLGDVAAASTVTVALYLSATGVVDTALDPLLDAFQVDAVPPRGMVDFVRVVRIPGDTPSGLWRVVAIVDTTDVLAELDEANNPGISPWLEVDASCYDPLEPNDTLDTARAVTPQTIATATAPNETGLVVCKGNPDFYRIRAISGTSLTVDVASDASLGDLDIVLRDAFGDEITSSRTTSNVESVHLPVIVGDQDLILEVFQHPNPFNADSSVYDLTVLGPAADPSLVCNAAFEPNDSFSSAASLLDAVASPTLLATCPRTDNDYYQVYLTSGTQLDIQVVTSSRSLRATLYDPSHNFVQTLFDPTIDTISTTIAAEGTYTLRVFAAAGASRQETYSLLVNGLDGPDLAPTALEVVPGSVVAGGAVQYTATIANSGAKPSGAFDVLIVLSDDALITYADQELVRLEGLPSLAAGAQTALGQKIDIPANTPAGNYFVGVVADPEDGLVELNEFNNERSAALVVNAVCLADAYDTPTDNNVPSRASDLDLASPATAAICPGDVDWWAFDATGLASATITASFSHALGDLDLTVYDASFATIAVGRSVTDHEVVVLAAPAAGTVYVEVRGFTGATRNDYTLQLSTL